MDLLSAVRMLFDAHDVRQASSLSEERRKEIQEEVRADPSRSHGELLMYELAVGRLLELHGEG